MWTGDTAILSNQLLATTSALIPAMNVSITATYIGGGGGGDNGGTGTGLLGQYHNDSSGSAYPLSAPFVGAPALTRTDATVDFPWGGGSPDAAVTPDNFSVKWSGQVEAPVTGSYTFTVRGDDGVRLFINGAKVLDGWSDHGAMDFTYTTNLTAATKYGIELQFYEHGGGAESRLQWSYPGQAKQAIPQSRLYPATTQQVAAPVLSPPPGTYASAQSVALTTSTAGATIRYTTDGSNPTDSNGTLYSGPVPIGGTTTLKAIAYKAGMINSAVTSGIYTINSTPSFALTVNGGSGSGSYAVGATVNVSANAPAVGQQFAGWTGDTSIVTSPSSASTTATMPSSNAMITATYSGTSGDTGTGLRGQYYNDSGASYPLANPFTGTPVLTRTDGTVDFGWGDGSPGVPVTSNNFSAKWTGKVKAPVTGSYTFTVRGDDGVRLFLDGTTVVDGWSDHGATDYTYTVDLAAGTMHDVELHFYENGGGAECRLQWSYPGQGKQAIPQSQLFPAAGYALTVNNGNGDGNYTTGTQVNVSADPPPAAQKFVGWTGDTSILADPSASFTTATVGTSNASISATYQSTTTGSGLLGQYYHDSSGSIYPLANPFGGTPVLTRTDAVVDFSWSAGSPASSITPNFFSVKWTGQVKAPVSGTYTFTVTGDDGVRFFINGVKVIDGWKDQGAAPYTYTTTLVAGTLYDVELHYYEHEGDAACRLQWSYPGQPTQVIPSSQLYPPAQPTQGTGLRGQYYNDNSNMPYPLANPFASSPVLVRLDPVVDFNFGDGSPGSPVTSNFFSAKWTGQVKAPVSGAYTFTITGDDGVRFFIDGTNVIDGWRDQGATAYSYTTTLSAGTVHDIELQYYEHEGGAACRLQWSYPGQAIQTIPQSQLFPPTL
jgi:hypothetical protein